MHARRACNLLRPTDLPAIMPGLVRRAYCSACLVVSCGGQREGEAGSVASPPRNVFPQLFSILDLKSRRGFALSLPFRGGRLQLQENEQLKLAVRVILTCTCSSQGPGRCRCGGDGGGASASASGNGREICYYRLALFPRDECECVARPRPPLRLSVEWPSFALLCSHEGSALRSET